MHEYGITKQILKIAVDEAKKAGGQRILEIHLAIGDLSTVMDESVQMYFDVLSEGTLAEGARLVFHRIPAEFHCEVCHKNFEKPAKGFRCPICGTDGHPTQRGREFYIKSLVLED